MSQAFLQHVQFTRPRMVARVRLQVDKVSGEPVLLYPEGVVLLNATGAAIIRLCDGSRTFAEILAALAAAYHTPVARLEGDVSTCLDKLYRQSLVELLTVDEEKEVS